MNKASMGAMIATKHGLTVTEGTRIVDTVFEAIKASLMAQGAFSYYGFGRLQVVERAARRGRDPNTGDAITIGPRLAVKFALSPALKKAIADGRKG